MSFTAKLIALLLLVAVGAAFGPPPSFSASPTADWEPVGDGVDHRAYSLTGPVRVHVARLDVQEPKAFIESAVAGGGVSSGLEPVSAMARRYDGALTTWGGEWGGRSRVLVAVNGSSYNPETSEPYGGLFHSGWYSLRYGDLAGGTGFVWTRSRVPAIRGCVEHDGSRQRVTRLLDGTTFELDALNERRSDDGLLLFNPQFGAFTPEGRGETEVVVQVERPVGVLPPPKAVEGFVIEVRQGNGQTPILFDQVVLAARGPAAAGFVRQLEAGERLGISQDITDLGFGCRGQERYPWDDVFSAIGGGFVFLRDGEVWHSDDWGASVREPRTAICLNQTFVYFVVVDGRNHSLSVGMSLDQLAGFCRDELGATWGLNQDGGGSSTMWVNGRVVNTPSDGSERPVANGLMMMAFEPAVRSNRFDPGFEVTLQVAGAVRLGPGETQPVSGFLEAGRLATVARAPQSLQGAFAQGSFWWKVEADGELGWIAEQSLVSPGEALSLFRMLPPPRTAAP